MKWKYLSYFPIVFYVVLMVLFFTMPFRRVILIWIIFGLVSFTLFSATGLYYILVATKTVDLTGFKRLGVALLIGNSVQLIFVLAILILYLFDETDLAIITAAVPFFLAAVSLRRYFKERRPPVLATRTGS